MADNNPRDTKENVVVEKDSSVGTNIGFLIGILLLLALLYMFFINNPFSGNGGETTINLDVPTVNGSASETPEQ
jgi:hypothetical protein